MNIKAKIKRKWGRIFYEMVPVYLPIKKPGQSTALFKWVTPIHLKIEVIDAQKASGWFHWNHKPPKAKPV